MGTLASRFLRPVLGLLLLLGSLETTVAAPPTYSVAIVAQFSAQQIHAEWQPLLKRVGDEPGKALLKDVRIPNPVAADYARDYGRLEKLRLDKYLVLEE